MRNFRAKAKQIQDFGTKQTVKGNSIPTVMPSTIVPIHHLVQHLHNEQAHVGTSAGTGKRVNAKGNRCLYDLEEVDGDKCGTRHFNRPILVGKLYKEGGRTYRVTNKVSEVRKYNY